MIDLHTHTIYSDGTDTIKEYLEKAQNIGLNTISITDHNTCKAYKEIEIIDVKSIYKGNIITGVELSTKVLGIPIEILGYKMNTTKMQELIDITYVSSEKSKRIELKRLKEKCDKEGIILPEGFEENFDPKMWPSKYLSTHIVKDERNKKNIDEDAWNDSNVFYRKYMSNPDSKFYVNMDDLLPDFETASKIIRQAGGLVFIPHIFEYRENAEKILNYILNNYKIDGIECYYTTFTKEQTNRLLEICKERNLLISGGSDYHGANKKNTNLGTGKGNLQINDDIIKDWQFA